jgi:hypothetical protein
VSKNSGVTGKTVEQLRRSKAAAIRQQERDAVSTEDQLKALDVRPGNSARERARLNG